MAVKKKEVIMKINKRVPKYSVIRRKLKSNI